jgi:hypothetical protein
MRARRQARTQSLFFVRKDGWSATCGGLKYKCLFDFSTEEITDVDVNAL